MSIFNRLSSPCIRDHYRPIQFENILRNYEEPPKLMSKNTSNQLYQFEKKVSGENKEVKPFVDLNKKMKIARVSSQNSENDKENVQMNGNMVWENKTGLKNTFWNLANFNDERKEEKCLNLEEFYSEEKNNSEEANCNGSVYEPEEIENECFSKEQNLAELKLINFESEYIPDCIEPIKQVSFCEVLLEHKSNICLDEKDELELIVQSKEQNQQIEQQAVQIHEQLRIPNQVQEIKTKLSLRLLKKKLKNHSVEEVAMEAIENRKIELCGLTSEPNKEEVYEALVSFMKTTFTSTQ